MYEYPIPIRKEFYSPEAIANYFIDKALEDNIELPLTKLLKLVYLAHCWYYGYKDRPLIDEKFVAWEFGPVLQSLYYKLRNDNYKKSIRSKIINFNGQNFVEPVVYAHDNETLEILESVWHNYKNYSGKDLTNLSHEKGGPWDIVWNELGGRNIPNAVIPNELIHEHFYNILASNELR